ncbi:hypothetical protein [Synechococcus phage Yong-M4-211]|nr:hypothetical protein [Synechococcus phage Yong-M4-211]
MAARTFGPETRTATTSTKGSFARRSEERDLLREPIGQPGPCLRVQREFGSSLVVGVHKMPLRLLPQNPFDHLCLRSAGSGDEDGEGVFKLAEPRIQRQHPALVFIHTPISRAVAAVTGACRVSLSNRAGAASVVAG